MRSQPSGGPPGQLVALTVDGLGGGRPGSARDAGGYALPWQTNAAIVVELLVHVISLPCDVGAFDLNAPTISVREGV
jgi:hypothetical protein